MANLNETATWEAGVYQWETTDPVTGGASGIMNTPTRQLANRTTYLKGQVDGIIAGTVGISPSSLNAPVPLSKGGTGKALTANAGSIVFSDADSLELTSTADLTWDNTNKRLGIGGSPAHALQVYGASRLVQGLYSSFTGGSSATTNLWFELGTITLSAQYHQCALNYLISDDGGNGSLNASGMALVYLRVKQQNALGGAPILEANVSSSYGTLGADRLAAVITQNDVTATVVKLYAQLANTFTNFRFTVLNNPDNGRFVATSQAAGVASLPSGTVVTPTQGTHTSFSGNIGVGESTPDSRLHVYQNSADTGTVAGVTVEQAGAGDAVVQYLLTGSQRWVSGIDNSDGDKFKIAPNTDVGSNTALTITPTGDLGIGAATPSAKLHVAGNGWFQGSGIASITFNDGTQSTAVGQASAPGAAWSSSLSNTGYVLGPDGGNVQIVAGPMGSKAARVTVLPGGNVGVGTNAPARLLTVAKSGNSYQVEPHASGVDLYSTGNIGYHYQTDLSFYTGVPGSGTLRQKFNASGTIQASAPTYGSAGSVNLVPVLNASGVLDRQSVGQRAAAGTNMSGVSFGYNASYADVGTSTNWPSISLATTNRIVKVTFSGDGQTDRSAENLSVRLKITDGAMAVQTGNNVNVRPTTTNVPANLHITQIFTVAASGTVTAALQALNSSGVAVHTYSGRVTIEEI